MQNLPQFPETPKIFELRTRFLEAKAKDSGNTFNNFYAFVDSVKAECAEKIVETFAGEPPSPQLKLCSDDEYKEAQKLFRARQDSLAFIDHNTNTVYLNLEKHLEFPTRSFVTNLAVSLIEELLHSAFPHGNESETVMKTFDVMERYLGIHLDEPYKEQSLARARESQ